MVKSDIFSDKKKKTRNDLYQSTAREMAASKSKIVRLNVGGEVFATSSTTLLSVGETFFTSLLSGRHDTCKDESGAFFIDRSPKYFEPILHFLRTNTLEVPSGLSCFSLKEEAQFYGIQKIVDLIEHDEKEKMAKSELPKTVLPYLKDFGCYVNADNDHAFLFGSDDKLTCISGYEAFTQSLVVQSYPQVPAEWKSDQSHARSFAIFYESHVSKGTYKMNKEGMGMILTLPGKQSNSASIRQHLATLSKDATKLCVTSYSCSSGSGLFMCQHTNPNHFHLYKLHKF